MNKQIIFIDSRVSDYQSLLDSLTAPYDVFVLDADKDGLSQMADYLQGQADLDAIHVISHGSPAALYLGDSVLNAATLAFYADHLASIGRALTASGDILLYGCNVAEGEAGGQFVESLALATGADVAASTDLTGGAELGGDWVLEQIVGEVAELGLSAEGFSGLLTTNSSPTFVVSDGKVTTDVGWGSDMAQSVTVQPDGKILVAGSSNMDFALVRYNTNGNLDASFDTDGKVTTDIGLGINYGQSVALQSDGKILVAGSSVNVGKDDFTLVRYHANGSLDVSFDSDGMVTTAIGLGQAEGHSIVVQPDGKILVAGTAYNGSNYDFALVRYNVNGSLDTSFGVNGNGNVITDIGRGRDLGHSVTVQLDGKILVAGDSFNGTHYEFALVRYNSDGSLDTSFDGDGKLTTAIGVSSEGQSVIVQADGKILVAGSGNGDFALVRYNANGSLDTSFDGDGKLTTAIGTQQDNGQSVTVQTDGKILVAGSSYNGTNMDFALVRYNADGSLDTIFDGDGKVTTGIGQIGDYGVSVALQLDGKILVAGDSNSRSNYRSDQTNVFALTRYHTDGSLDTSFDLGSTLDGNPVFVENYSAEILDSEVMIFDAELAAIDNYAGATLTLARHGNASVEDQFSGVGIVSGQAGGL